MLARVWDDFLYIAREEAGSRVVETWFKAVSLERWDSLQKTVYLSAPNTFVKDWIKNNYIPLFQTHLGRLLNVQDPKIIFIDAHLESSTMRGEFTDSVSANSTSFSIIPAKSEVSKTALTKTQHFKNQSHINTNYIFSNFVVGPSNSLAYAAAQAITEKLGELYNPLFIYGGSGLGKTHLLHAIGNEIKLLNRHATILYQTADRFVNEFITAIRFDKVHKFQSKYKEIDVLLIDDIQFISNKEQTQEAFFHIFNSLYDARKQLVFSSDTFPQDMQGIAERLRSRLACGLVTDIYMPSLETKIAILKKKSDSNQAFVPDDVAYFIASRAIANIRELEGALVRVVAFASLTKQPICLELAKKVLIRQSEQGIRAVDFDAIAKVIQKIYGYSLVDLQSKNRGKELALARQIAMFMMKKLTDKSLRDIGIFLGGRDHSTVMYALGKVEQQRQSNENLAFNLKKIEQELVG